MPETRTCSHCTYWNPKEPDRYGAGGECRISPPEVLPFPIDGSPASYWPPTRPDAWCGQFEKWPGTGRGSHSARQR